MKTLTIGFTGTRSGIYRIQSTSKPERVYIGSTVNLARRKNEHFRRLKQGIHSNKKLQNHYNKYGKEDLVFHIMEVVDKQKLLLTEQYYIDATNPAFNINKRVKAVYNTKQTTETRQKRSTSIKKAWDNRTDQDKRKHGSKVSKGLRAYYGDIPNQVKGFILTDLNKSDKNRQRVVLARCIYCDQEKEKTYQSIKSKRKNHCGCQIKNLRPSCKKIKGANKNVHLIGACPAQGKIRKDNSSGYRGVTYDKASGDWRARVKHKGKQLDAGRYNSPLEAVKGRDWYIIENNLPHSLQILQREETQTNL